eukprot:s1607_g8.t1
MGLGCFAVSTIRIKLCIFAQLVGGDSRTWVAPCLAEKATRKSLDPCFSWQSFGKEKAKKGEAGGKGLEGSSHLEHLRAAFQQVIEMTWYCQECQAQNAQKYEYCKSCQQHWGQVWNPPKRSSRSKSRQKSKETKEEAKDQDKQWQLFQDQVPWVPSAPSRASSYRADAMVMSVEKEAPQPTTLPVTPQALEVSANSLTPDEIKVLEHLRGLQSMNIEMPPLSNWRF